MLCCAYAVSRHLEACALATVRGQRSCTRLSLALLRDCSIADMSVAKRRRLCSASLRPSPAMWCERGGAVARAFADMAAAWVRGYEGELASLESGSCAAGYAAKRAALQCSCAVASMLVVLCFGFAGSVRAGQATPAALGAEDAVLVLSHLVRARYYRLASQVTAATGAQTLWAGCLRVAAQTQPEIGRHCDTATGRKSLVGDGGKGSVLSTAVRVIFRQLPEGLAWQQTAEGLGCYAAEHVPSASGARAYYTVNILTGAALRNSLAPARLPAGVLKHALYKRTFGDLEVEVDDDFKTRQPLQGRVYQSRRSGSRLCIEETAGEGADAETLELLPGALSYPALVLEQRASALTQ